MPFTVITVKKAPASLRGDLTKWMQEIATGVYVGNFNTRVREELWKRVLDSIGSAEATMAYQARGELGYKFETVNADRLVVDYEGIPLILIPKNEDKKRKEEHGFSKAAKFSKARKYSNKSSQNKKPIKIVALDLETDGLDPYKNRIIEIGAIKKEGEKIEEFQKFIVHPEPLPEKIKNLTGLDEKMLKEKGEDPDKALKELVDFLGNFPILGFNLDFDMNFLNTALKENKLPPIKNKRYDLLKYAKREKMFLESYKLDKVLQAYGIGKKSPHRALEDARLTLELSEKIEKFKKDFNRVK